VEASRAEEHGARLDGEIAYVHQESVCSMFTSLSRSGCAINDILDLFFVLEMIVPQYRGECSGYDNSELALNVTVSPRKSEMATASE
jgi:hypothetical protein